MISSMTAYSIREIKNTWGSLIWELRSVNQRYLEIYIRLPETFRNLEPIIRDRIRNRLTRGKIECYLRFDAAHNKKWKLQLDESLAKELVQAAKWVKIQSDEGVINPLDILRWPGVMLMQESELYSINSELLAIFDNTLDEFISMRKSEGKALKSLIEQRLKSVTQEVSKIRIKIPDIIKLQHAKFIEKLKSVEIQLENNRLEQELIMIIQRMDVTEELDRLDTHVKETFEILEKNEAIGRRLDFMMQEFNRESNTLASKSNSTDITSSAIELKVLIEQMREQIQNIE